MIRNIKAYSHHWTSHVPNKTHSLTFSAISDSSWMFFFLFWWVYFSSCSFMKCFNQLFNCPTHMNHFISPLILCHHDHESAFHRNGGVQLVSVGVKLALPWSIVNCCMIWHQWCIWTYIKKVWWNITFPGHWFTTAAEKKFKQREDVHRELQRSTDRWWRTGNHHTVRYTWPVEERERLFFLQMPQAVGDSQMYHPVESELVTPLGIHANFLPRLHVSLNRIFSYFPWNVWERRKEK